MVHIAEIFTTAASGASHWWHRNVDWTIVRRIAIPGTIGGILGATLLSNVDGKVIAPFVTVYLALMGVLIPARAIRKFTTVEPNSSVACSSSVSAAACSTPLAAVDGVRS